MPDPKIELIYERTCPNVEAARALIKAACAQIGCSAEWHEWEVSDARLPAYARGFGSPTILVDMVDVAGQSAGVSDCCRIYPGGKGVQGVPALEQVVQALKGCR
ncbi:MAG: hypothetical protein KKA36_03130 [Gammaproteobacteria bacterium]|nr:hypothetical protein [Gammaproteobacteria bacterium]MBU2478056.1 hypothetical protein [Gammaproteobacteria bacterium]